MCAERISAPPVRDESREERRPSIQEVARSTPVAAGSHCPLCHEPQPLLSINAAAALAGVTRKTIYRWMGAGLLPSLTLPSGSTRILRQSLMNVPRRARRSQ